MFRYEIMINPESCHNLFRLLHTRDLDHTKLQGVIFDNCCNFNSYLLNREARRYEYLLCLVDISHFKGHKKIKKGYSKSPGHVGCSNGFNSELYKENFGRNFNSQGREQFHSLLQKVSTSFNNMSFSSYMTMIKVFAVMRNLKNKGVI